METRATEIEAKQERQEKARQPEWEAGKWLGEGRCGRVGARKLATRLTWRNKIQGRILAPLIKKFLKRTSLTVLQTLGCAGMRGELLSLLH